MVDFKIILEDQHFKIRPLIEQDKHALHQSASDPLIWEQHPDRNRHEKEQFERYFNLLLLAGGAMALECKEVDRIIGCSRFYLAPNSSSDWSIGFTFIERKFWGGKANFNIKTLMLDYLFSRGKKVWFHIDKNNIRSQKATMKLGAIPMGECSADLLQTGIPVHYLNFVVTDEIWAKTKFLTSNG